MASTLYIVVEPTIASWRFRSDSGGASCRVTGRRRLPTAFAFAVALMQCSKIQGGPSNIPSHMCSASRAISEDRPRSQRRAPPRKAGCALCVARHLGRQGCAEWIPNCTFGLRRLGAHHKGWPATTEGGQHSCYRRTASHYAAEGSPAVALTLQSQPPSFRVTVQVVHACTSNAELEPVLPNQFPPLWSGVGVSSLQGVNCAASC